MSLRPAISKIIFGIIFLFLSACNSEGYKFFENHFHYNNNRRDVAGNRYDLYQSSTIGYDPDIKKPVRYKWQIFKKFSQF